MHHGSDAARTDTGVSPGSVGLRPSSAFARQAVPVLLIATAVFLLVLILTRTPLNGFVVSQRVRSAADRTTTASPLATEQVVSWLRSDAVLAAAVQQSCPRDSLATQQNLIADLQAGLDVQPDATRPTQFGWHLTLQHRDRQLASRLLSSLGQSLTAQLKHLDRAEAQLLVQHYQKALLVARDEEDSARQALDRARHEQLTVAMQTAPDQPSYVVPILPTPTRSNVDPIWQDLQQKVQIAKARLEQLLSNRTDVHPQVIEAQSQLTQLEEQLSRTPREPHGPAPQTDGNSPEIQGPQLREAAQSPPRMNVKLISSTVDARDANSAVSAGALEILSARWSSAATKRAAAERTWSEAQQQWVRGLNAEGWEATPVWTEAQFGGRATSHQLLLASLLACGSALGAWRLTYLAACDGALTTSAQLAETLPLPVMGSVPMSIEFPKRQHERVNSQVSRLSQLSLAVIAAVVLVVAWASSIDASLSAQWTSDPFSALGQAFDLLHHRVLG